MRHNPYTLVAPVTAAILCAALILTPRIGYTQLPANPKAELPKMLVLQIPEINSYGSTAAATKNNSWQQDDYVRRSIIFEVEKQFPKLNATDAGRETGRRLEAFERMKACAYDPAACEGNFESYAAPIKAVTDLIAPAVAVVPGGAILGASIAIGGTSAPILFKGLDKPGKELRSLLVRHALREVRFQAQARFPYQASDFGTRWRAENDGTGRLHQFEERYVRPQLGFSPGKDDREMVQGVIDRTPAPYQSRLQKVFDGHNNGGPKKGALCKEIRDCAQEVSKGALQAVRPLIPGKEARQPQVRAADDPGNAAIKQKLDDLSQVMRALGAVARLIDPTVGREMEAVTTFVAETATAVGTYLALSAGGVPGLVAGITLAVVHLIANLTAGEDPSVTLLREFREAIQEVFERFGRVDAKLEKLSNDLFEQFERMTALILKEGEDRRKEAAGLLSAIEKLDQKLDRRFAELTGLINGWRESNIEKAVKDAIDPVGIEEPNGAERIKEKIESAVELIRVDPQSRKRLVAFDDVVADMPVSGGRAYPWLYLGQAATAATKNSGVELESLDGDVDLVNHLFRVGQYARLFEGAPDAYKFIKPEVTQKLLDRTRAIAYGLTRQTHPRSGSEVVPAVGKADPVLDGLLERYEAKRREIAVGLTEDRNKFELGFAGLDPLGLPDQLRAPNDQDLIPASIVKAEGAKWSFEFKPQAPPLGLPALPLLPGERALIAAKLHPAIRNALRLKLVEATLEWTGATWGAADPYHTVNAGDLVVVRERRPIPNRDNRGRSDWLFFHGRLTLAVRLTLKPADPKLVPGGGPIPTWVYFDRTVTPPSELMGFALSDRLQYAERLSDLLDEVRNRPPNSLDIFQDSQEHMRLPGVNRLNKSFAEELAREFRGNPNAFAKRFAESPDKDLFSDEALIIRDDGYVHDSKAVALRLFPAVANEVERAAKLEELVRVRRTPEEFVKLKTTGLFTDAKGGLLPRRDQALKTVLGSRTESDLSEYWAKRTATELRKRQFVDGLAKKLVANRLASAGTEMLDRQAGRLNNPADDLGKAARELKGLALLIDAHFQMRYPRSYAGIPTLVANVGELYSAVNPLTVHREHNLVGPPWPAIGPVHQLRQLMADRPAELHPALEAAVVRLTQQLIVHTAHHPQQKR